MANIQITQLPASSPLTGSEAVPVVQNGVTVRTTTGAIAAASQTGYSYITVNQESNLANSRALQGGLGIGLVDGGPQNPLTIELNGASGSLEGAGTGFIAKTGGSNVVSRTFTAVGGGISVTNGDGVAGNPQISAAGLLQDIVGLTGTGILALNAGNAVTMLQIQGTANQINVASGAGPSDPTISIAANPVLPGVEGVTIPSGTTAERPSLPTNGEIRYNTDLGVVEGYINGSWQPVSTSTGNGTVTSVGFSADGTGFSVSGSPITSNGTITLSGTLLANHGGTGIDTYAVGDMLYAQDTESFAALPIGNDADVMVVVSGVPDWVDPAAISVGNAAFATLSELSNNIAGGGGNQIVYQTGVNETSFIVEPTGTGQVLSWNGTAFEWILASGTGTVTDVDVNGGTTGLTFSGGPVTTSGNITMSGVLAITAGGTGANTANAARVNLGLGTMALQNANVTGVTNNQLLQYNTSQGAWVNVSPNLVTVGFANVANFANSSSYTNVATQAVTATTANVAIAIQGGTGNQLVYQTGANTTNFVVAPGGGSAYLKWTGSAFQWANPVTSVDANGGTTGLTFTGGPITSTGNLTLSGTLAITAGGTGATDAANARTNLGLGTIATQNANNVSITGGSVNVSYLESTNGVKVAGNIASPTFIQMNTAPGTVTSAVGRMWWDGGTTMNMGMTANVTQEIGESQFFYVKASAAITKGQAVMATGAVGASGVITAAPASNVTNGQYLMGVAAESIALNDFGLIQQFGLVRGFDTSGAPYGETWADGDVLYYNPAYVGGLTKTLPSAPNVKATMALVINASSGGSGSIFVRVSSGSVLGGTDSNVQFGNLANKQLIQYNSASQIWTNVDASNVTVGNISGVLSVANGGTGSNATPTAGQLLIGNNVGFTLATITAGSNINITNGPGTITISSTGGGGSSNVSANTAYAYAWFIS